MDFAVCASYYEIYNERLIDLLNDGTEQQQVLF